MKTEKALGSIAIMGIFFRIMNYAGGDFLMFFGLITLSFYYYFGFSIFNDIEGRNIFKKDAYKDISIGKIIGSVLLGFSLSAVLMGIIFKLNIYPGALLTQLSGLIPLLIISIIAFIKFLKNNEVFYKKALIRSVIIGGFGLLVLFTPVNTLIDIYYRTVPEYAEAYKKVQDNPNDEEARKELLIIEEKIF